MLARDAQTKEATAQLDAEAALHVVAGVPTPITDAAEDGGKAFVAALATMRVTRVNRASALAAPAEEITRAPSAQPALCATEHCTFLFVCLFQTN